MACARPKIFASQSKSTSKTYRTVVLQALLQIKEKISTHPFVAQSYKEINKYF